MADSREIRGSDGSGEAVLATVTGTRAISSTTLAVDAVTNWPSYFIATSGTLNAGGVLTPGTIQVFHGHLSGGNIIIDSFADGYSDLGNSIGQVVVIKQTTEWANNLTDIIDAEHNTNGTHAAITATSVSTDTISEKTSANGVTIDGLNIKDGALTTANSVPQSVLSTTAGNGPLKSKIITLTRDGTATGGDVSYTGVGFIPSSIYFLMNVDNSTYRSDGFVDSAKTGICTYQSAANLYWSQSAAAITYSNQSAWAQSAIVKSYDADGFTLTWTKTGTPTAGTLKVTAICYR